MSLNAKVGRSGRSGLGDKIGRGIGLLQYLQRS